MGGYVFTNNAHGLSILLETIVASAQAYGKMVACLLEQEDNVSKQQYHVGRKVAFE